MCLIFFHFFFFLFINLSHVSKIQSTNDIKKYKSSIKGLNVKIEREKEGKIVNTIYIRKLPKPD